MTKFKSADLHSESSRNCVEFTANSRICKLRAFEASGLAFVVNFRLSDHSFNLDYKYLCAVNVDFVFCFFFLK